MLLAMPAKCRESLDLMNVVIDIKSTQIRSIIRQLSGLLAIAVMVALMPSISWTEELSPIETRTIAREASIYGFPLIEKYKMMYDFAIDQDGAQYQAPLNTLKHRDALFSPGETSVATPNIDTLYSFLWMDLQTEPIVLSVPEIGDDRYYSIQLSDLYNYTFDYIGTRATGNKAGRYLIAGPSWNGETPDGINKIIHCETQFALALYRTQLLDPEDLDKAEELQSKYVVQMLSKYLGQPKPESETATNFPPPDAMLESDYTLVSNLNFLLQFCPVPESERELRARFARIGVSTDAKFDLAEMSPDNQEALKQGLAEGREAISAAASKLKVAEVIGTRGFLKGDYIKRAVAAKLGGFSNSREEALYPLYLSDAEGNPLDASETKYVLKFGPDDLPPVNAFWSITMYDGTNQALVANPIDRYQISSILLENLVRDEDGGLSLSIQHDAPVGDRAQNWLPAPAGPFYMVMRLYWPKQVAYEGTWVPPLVWPEDITPSRIAPKPTGAESAEEVKPSIIADEPNPEMERPTIWGEPTEVQILIYVIDVDEINSADQSFAASIYYVARWKNPFLRHKGPGPINRGLSEVWNPQLTIVSQQSQWKSYPESVEIQPDGTVTYRQKIWGRFSQPLKLEDFPFDVQELSIHIVAAGILEEHVNIVPMVSEGGDTSRIAKEFSLPDFDVVSWQASPQSYFPVDKKVGVVGYSMKITVDRRPTFYILKVIIPLCLIVVMSWLPRWMDPEQTGTNVGISTSSFLTLVAYLFAITVLLPRVSYVTRMDRFILISTLIVFAGLIQTVANSFLIKREKRLWVERIDCWSRIVYPALLLTILVVSFVI